MTRNTAQPNSPAGQIGNNVPYCDVCSKACPANDRNFTEGGGAICDECIAKGLHPDHKSTADKERTPLATHVSYEARELLHPENPKESSWTTMADPDGQDVVGDTFEECLANARETIAADDGDESHLVIAKITAAYFKPEGGDRPRYYECGICNCYHPADWDGDCRDDSNRFTDDQLEAKHGPLGIGWDLVDMPGVEDPKPSRFLPETAHKGRK